MVVSCRRPSSYPVHPASDLGGLRPPARGPDVAGSVCSSRTLTAGGAPDVFAAALTPTIKL